jgi:hypothetical protein
MIEDRRQRTEDRDQRAENRGQITELGKRNADLEVRGKEGVLVICWG